MNIKIAVILPSLLCLTTLLPMEKKVSATKKPLITDNRKKCIDPALSIVAGGCCLGIGCAQDIPLCMAFGYGMCINGLNDLELYYHNKANDTKKNEKNNC